MSKTTIYRFLNLWWTHGQSKLALVPGSARNGNNQILGTARRGRAPQDGRYIVFQMQEQDITWAKGIIEKHYIKKEQATVASAHRRLVEKYYSFEDGNGNIAIRPEGEYPSIHQFRSILKKYYTCEQIRRGKYGDKEFDREHAPMVGSALEEAVSPGHIYEIDATILDVFLVAVANRECIIGKPTLYLIYDRKTRLCVGFYLGLENASWTGAMLAILSIAADKRALCDKYGHPYDPAQWPADGIFPSKFLGDRGEMISYNSDRICDGMNATISNTQSLLPTRKGLVESGFKVTHTAIKSDTPGYAPDFLAKKRRAKHYHLDASLTLDECISLVLGSIIEHNTTVMRRYELTPEQALADWDAIPNELWQNEVSHHGCAGSRYTYDYLQMQLMPRDKSAVTQDGIVFKGCIYSSDDETIRRWIIQAGLRKSFKVETSYDLRLVDRIIVHGIDGKTYPCYLTKDSKQFAGYSFAEVKYVRMRASRMKRANNDAKLQAQIDRQRRADIVIEGAKKATKAALTGAARSARRADTVAARNAEKKKRRQSEVRFPMATNDDSVTQFQRTESSQDRLSLVDSAPASAVPAKAESSVAIRLRQLRSEKTNELIHH